MNRTIRIGETDVPMRASALTSVIYRNLFGKDLTIEFNKMRGSSEASLLEDSSLELFRRLAFVMSWQAIPREIKTTEALKRLSIDDYYEWLDNIEEIDFYEPETLTAITNLWLNSQKAQIALKNAANPQ